jgi:putative nucleotidyltransferase with HDIG domain
MPVFSIHDLEQRLGRLPPFPAAAMRALDELGCDTIDFARVERATGTDPVLTARILRIANSPFYGLPRKISAVKDACMLTGAPTLRNVIIASVAMLQFSTDQITQTDRTALWRHSAHCAAFAAELAPAARQPRDVAFTAGLLHDIGTLALAALYPDEYARIRARGATLDAERDVLGATHAVLGAHVAEHWRLPFAIRDAIAAHHDPAAVEQATLADVVFTADTLAHAMDEGADATQAWSRVGDEVLARLPLDAEAREEMYLRGITLATAAAELFTGG